MKTEMKFTDSQMADACAYAAEIVYEHFGDGLDRSYALRSAASRLRGLGEQAAVPQMVVCPMCHGSGIDPDFRSQECPICQGHGVAAVPMPPPKDAATDQPAATDHGVWQPLVNAYKAGVTTEKFGEMAWQIAKEQT